MAGLAGVFAFGVAGCKKNSDTPPIITNGDPGGNGDPAAANLAGPYTGGNSGGYGTGQASSGQGSSGQGSSGSSSRVLGSSQSYEGQSSGEVYGDQEGGSAPIVRQAPSGYNGSNESYGSQGSYSSGSYGGGGYNSGSYGSGSYSDTEEAGQQALAETDQAPPPLPEYDQPPAPEPNYLWTPGYWNYAPTGYYWVPGVWCAPPFYGALWTPPWWGFYGSHYLFHRGYWGPHIGYYGGIDYGFGYIGTGYYGGYWRGRDFLYNRSVTNVNINVVHNVYERQVVYNGRTFGPHPDERVSYNGGRGGINVQPRPFELAAAREPHYAPLPAQRDVRLAAASNRSQFFAANGGRPAQAFAARPVGTPTNIASAPHEQPFNRLGGTNEGRPAPAATAAQPGLNRGAQRPGAPGLPSAGGQVGNNHPQPGASEPGGRPGFAGQPGVNGERSNPGFQGGRPAPAAQGVQRPTPPAQQMRPAPTVQQQRPAPNVQQQRPTPQVQQQRPAPNVQQQRPAPQFEQRPQPAPAAQPRPQVAAPRPQPAPAARPAPEARPAPAPHAAPEPHSAPAPHEAGGHH